MKPKDQKHATKATGSLRQSYRQLKHEKRSYNGKDTLKTRCRD
jgi:hypothetical protein